MKQSAAQKDPVTKASLHIYRAVLILEYISTIFTEGTLPAHKKMTLLGINFTKPPNNHKERKETPIHKISTMNKEKQHLPNLERGLKKNCRGKKTMGLLLLQHYYSLTASLIPHEASAHISPVSLKR